MRYSIDGKNRLINFYLFFKSGVVRAAGTDFPIAA